VFADGVNRADRNPQLAKVVADNAGRLRISPSPSPWTARATTSWFAGGVCEPWHGDEPTKPRQSIFPRKGKEWIFSR